MKCNLIGAGKLGKNIALALTSAQLISSFSICNRSIESAQNACHQVGAGTVVDTLDRLPEADLTWICCTDDAIEPVVRQLIQKTPLKRASFVIHSSGVHSSDLLTPLKKYGCFIASLHPLKAFTTNYLDPKAFNEVHCVLEGDPEVTGWLNTSFSQLGAHLIPMRPEAKAAYHAGACMASNYLITLASCCEELFIKSGISSAQSKQMILRLMQSNLDNLRQTSKISESLTGPIARGDVTTITHHLEALDTPEIKQLYQTAALSTIPITQLPESTKQQLHEVLKSVLIPLI